jgi:hypothetical protein
MAEAKEEATPADSGGGSTAGPGHSFPDCSLIAYRYTRTHSLHPPRWPGHSIPCQLNISSFEANNGSFKHKAALSKLK